MPLTQKRSTRPTEEYVLSAPTPPPTSFLFDELHCVMFFADGNQSVDWDYRSGELAGCQKTGECVDSSATKTHSVPRQRWHRSLPAEWSCRESHGATLRSSTALHSGTQHLRDSKQVWQAVQLSSVQFSSVQDGIYVFRKVHMRSTDSLRSFLNVIITFETVPIIIRFADNETFSSFQVRSSSASSFCTSLL